MLVRRRTVVAVRFVGLEEKAEPVVALVLCFERIAYVTPVGEEDPREEENYRNPDHARHDAVNLHKDVSGTLAR